MKPFESYNDIGQPIYKVAYQFGHRTLTREFPRTEQGKLKAEAHIKRLNEELRKHLPLSQ